MSHWIKELGLEQTPRDHGAFIIRNDTEYNVSSKHALMRVYVCLTPPSFPPRITCCHFFSFPFSLCYCLYVTPAYIRIYVLLQSTILFESPRMSALLPFHLAYRYGALNMLNLRAVVKDHVHRLDMAYEILGHPGTPVHNNSGRNKHFLSHEYSCFTL